MNLGPALKLKGDQNLIEDLFQFQLKVSFTNKENENEKGDERIER